MSRPNSNVSPVRGSGPGFELAAGPRFGDPRGMPAEKARDFKGTLKRLWRHMGAERPRLAIVFGLTVGTAMIGLLIPMLIGYGVDAMSKGLLAVDFSLLRAVVLIFVMANLVDCGIHFLQGWIMAGLAQRVVKGLRKTMFAKLQQLPIAYFDRYTHGEMMSRLSNDIDNISQTLSQGTVHLMFSSVMILGALIMMLILSPILTLASVITVPLVFLLTRTITKRTKILFREQQAVLGRLNGHIEESITGIHVVKAFNHEEKTLEDFEGMNGRLCQVGIQAQVWSGYIMPLMNVINNIGFAAVAGAGGALAVRGMITVGIIASFLGYSRQFGRPLNEIANIYNTLQTAMAGAERVFDVLDQTEEPKDLPEAVALIQPQGRITFEGVHFGYRPDVPVLKDVSFQAEMGSSIALVGPTGAGKTTVVQLLARFYDVTDGRILMDDRDIRCFTRDSLRRCFGIVLQDTYLFSGTIRDNVLYGRPEASEAEMLAAAAMANADVFIERLPQGYDTPLAESGGNLSQGQRQLLAIARAILANPAVLILDEATSSVDTRTEMHIQNAMLALRRGRTSFIIAHRLSTIRDADEILVIDSGTIVEQGRHEDLMAQGGKYFEMVESQLQNIAL